MTISRRRLITGVAAVAAAGGTTGVAAAQPSEDATSAAQWEQRWAPDPDSDGLDAFEGVEDDRANSHPDGQPHIYVADGAYRFDMHLVDVDTMTDRQRQEVKGLRADGDTVVIDRGQTWRLSHQVFIPDSLGATTTFTHIMQLFTPKVGPAMTVSLRRVDGVETIELKDLNESVVVGRTELAPLKERWIDLTVDLEVADAPDGVARFVITDGDTEVLNARKTGLGVTLGDRCRPKWGIYRSLDDDSDSLRDAHMLIRNLRAHQRV